MTRSTAREAMTGRGNAARAAAVVAVACSGLLAACGGSTTPKVSASTLLQKAKATADATPAVHFQLTSSNVPLTGTNLVSGEGDLARPDSMQGSFDVAVSGFTAKVSVVSVNGVFEAKLPFASKYSKTNPADFGLKDPGQLLNPTTGLTSLLVRAQDPKLGSQERIAGELLDTVTYTVPGTAIPVLPDANPSKPVTLTVAINPSSYQLREVTLVGPLTSATSNSTYRVTLTHYGEHVDIALPPA